MTYDPNYPQYAPYGQPPAPQPPKKTGRKIATVVGGSIVGLILFASCVAVVTGDDGTTSGSRQDSGTSSGGEAKKSDGKKDNSFGNGDYEVGTDIKPGTYVSEGAEQGIIEFCSASTAGADGTIHELKSAGAGERVILVVTSDDFLVNIAGCEPFILRK